jgi:hypothetical protein
LIYLQIAVLIQYAQGNLQALPFVHTISILLVYLFLF